MPATRVSPLLVEDPELDTPLTRTAAPVLASLAEALADQSVGIMLADQHGLVLTRQVADALVRSPAHRPLAHARLRARREVRRHQRDRDRPGDRGSGPRRGTRALRRAPRGPGLPAAPIHHPITGRTMGVLDLTSRSKEGGSLLLTLALTTAAQIEADLLSTTGPATRRLVDEYLRSCHRSSSVVLAVGDEIAMMNDRARALLTSADQARLLRHGAEAFRSGRHAPQDLGLDRGVTARMTCHLVQHAGVVDGLVLRVRLLGPSRDTHDPRPPEASVSCRAWSAAPLWTQAGHRVEQAFTAGTWLALVGEPGVGKRSLLRAVQLRRQPVPRLTVLDCARAGEAGWSASLERAAARLSPEPRAAPRRRAEPRSAAIRGRGATPGPTRRRTVGGGHPGRRRPRRAPGRAAQTLPGHRRGAPAPAAPRGHRAVGGPLPDPAGRRGTTDLLGGGPGHAHPGPLAGQRSKLLSLVAHVLGRRRSGVIECHDLPAAAHSVSRRQLSPLESLERDAIVRALEECGGDKVAAAAALGMSRATIYRRIRTYAIAD